MSSVLSFPLPEVVIAVDDRPVVLFKVTFQFQNRLDDRFGVVEQIVPADKVEVVEHVDDE